MEYSEIAATKLNDFPLTVCFTLSHAILPKNPSQPLCGSSCLTASKRSEKNERPTNRRPKVWTPRKAAQEDERLQHKWGDLPSHQKKTAWNELEVRNEVLLIFKELLISIWISLYGIKWAPSPPISSPLNLLFLGRRLSKELGIRMGTKASLPLGTQRDAFLEPKDQQAGGLRKLPPPLLLRGKFFLKTFDSCRGLVLKPPQKLVGGVKNSNSIQHRPSYLQFHHEQDLPCFPPTQLVVWRCPNHLTRLVEAYHLAKRRVAVLSKGKSTRWSLVKQNI